MADLVLSSRQNAVQAQIYLFDQIKAWKDILESTQMDTKVNRVCERLDFLSYLKDYMNDDRFIG